MDVAIRPIDQHDLPEAERIFRLAFGTFLGLPDPMSFMGDADLVKTRWLANPAAALGAYVDSALVGSNFAVNWGSFGFFGPLTVRPDLWDKGIAQRLLEATMRLFEQWGTRQAALFYISPELQAHCALPEIRFLAAVSDSGDVKIDRASNKRRALVDILRGTGARPRDMPRRLPQPHPRGVPRA